MASSPPQSFVSPTKVRPSFPVCLLMLRAWMPRSSPGTENRRREGSGRGCPLRPRLRCPGWSLSNRGNACRSSRRPTGSWPPVPIGLQIPYSIRSSPVPGGNRPLLRTAPRHPCSFCPYTTSLCIIADPRGNKQDQKRNIFDCLRLYSFYSLTTISSAYIIDLKTRIKGKIIWIF